MTASTEKNMHDWLAQVYGTGEMEKTAGEELLEQFAAEAGVDVDDLSDEERQELSAELEEVASGYEAAGEGDEYEEYEEGEDEEAIEKFAEADFLGRVMAHSMTQELEKLGAARWKREMGLVGPSSPPRTQKHHKADADLRARVEKARAGFGSKDSKASKVDEAINRRSAMGVDARRATLKSDAKAYAAAKPSWFRRAGSAIKDHVVKHKGKYIPGAVGLGAAGLGYALSKEAQAVREKIAEAQFEQAVEERALQIVAELSDAE